MTKTKYYDLQMDDPQDDYDVEVVNANLKKIDEQMKTRENATDALQEPEFTVADKRENIASKEKMPKILGKIAKFFTDLKRVAFTGDYADLINKYELPKATIKTLGGVKPDGKTTFVDTNGVLSFKGYVFPELNINPDTMELIANGGEGIDLSIDADGNLIADIL